MQGKLIFAIALAAFGADAALAGDTVRRQACPKAEQVQQRQQPTQKQQQRKQQTQRCPATRTIPPVVDPTPVYFL